MSQSTNNNLSNSIINQNLNNSTYNSDKDNLISHLKTQIFDLEQNEKNYQLLQSKYKNLSNDAAILNEEKMRLGAFGCASRR